MFFDKHLYRICWLSTFILSLGVCIGVIYQTYEKWQNSPIIVNLASEESNIYEIPFPAVTICHEVKVSRSYFNFSDTLKKLINKEEVNEEK